MGPRNGESMTSDPPELFKNRDVTQDFLFSHSDGLPHAGAAATRFPPAPRAGDIPLEAHFAEMLDRPGLIAAIDTDMATAPALCALAVQVAWEAGTHAEEAAEADISEHWVVPIATLCRLHGGKWARIGTDRCACVFGHLNAAAGTLLARDLLQAYPQGRHVVTIGIAVYPSINFTRSQTVANAEKALDHAGFLEAGSIAGFDAVSLNISGDRLYQAGDITGAIAEFKRGLLLDPTDANLHNSLGVCYGVLQAYDEALSAFENAIWLAPQEGMATYNKGYILLLQKQTEQALDCFLRADAREPNLFEVVFHIGLAYMQIGAADKARPFFEAAARIKRRSGAAFVNLGACLDQLGLTKEAAQAFKRAVKINPADAESLSNLGRLYTQRGESLDVAAVLCQQSVQLSPHNGLFSHRLGDVYLHQGKLDQALAAFETAAVLGHDSTREIDDTRERMLAAKAS